jgi:hypothetical protein
MRPPAWHEASAADRGHPGAGVCVTACYGTYSSPYPAKRLPSGYRQPLDQNRPVWLVTYFGPGVIVPAGHVPDASGQVPIVHRHCGLLHVPTVDVPDAATGQPDVLPRPPLLQHPDVRSGNSELQHVCSQTGCAAHPQHLQDPLVARR